MQSARIILFLSLVFSGGAGFAAPASATAKTRVSKQELASYSAEIKKIEQRIAITTAEIKRVRDTDFLPDLYFSLADLHLQKSRFMYLLKVGKNSGVPLTELDFTAEKRPKLEAVEIYQKIYAFFPKSKLRDRALFFKALELRDLGQGENMIKAFGQLAKDFPESEHLLEANIILGDYFLEEKKDVEGALEVFRRILAKPDLVSPFVPLAHYRIGWCLINLQKHAEAVAAFEEAVRSQALIGRERGGELPELYRKTDIVREAIVAMAVPYVEVYADYKAKLNDSTKQSVLVLAPVEYFRKISDSHLSYRRVLARVGRRLTLKQMWADVAETWTEVLIANSDPEIKFEAIQRWSEAIRKSQAKTNRLLLIEHTVQTAQDIRARAVARSGGLSAKDKSQLKFLELITRDISTRIQQAARDTSGTEGFRLAAWAYELYQIGFPENSNLQKMLVNKAESLYRSEQWTKAGLEFENLARLVGEKKKKTEFKESAIESYVNALKTPDRLSPLDLVQARRAVREIGTDWILTHMKHPAAASTAYNIAQSWYEDRLLPQAIQAFGFFIKSFPQDARVRDAIFLTINGYSQLDDLKGLVIAAKNLEKTRGLSAEDRQAIRDASRRAQLKEIQSTAGDFGSKSYASNLVSAASKYGDSSMGATALYEAFSSLRSKRDPAMYGIGETLLEKHSDSTYTKEVVSSMAQTALLTADFERAARYLARFSEKYPKEKEVEEWRKNAAQIYDWLGRFTEARGLYAVLGDVDNVARLEFLLADWSHLEKTAASLSGSAKDYYLGLALWRQGRHAEAMGPLRAIAVRGSEEADRSAQARFLMVQKAVDSFRAIQMKNAADQASLVGKVKAFQALSKELGEIVAVGAGRWTIASLYLLGQANFELGRFIAGSPLPQGLKAADLQAYKAELTTQAKQYVDAANKVFDQCVSTAEKFEVFTRYVEGCRARGRIVVNEEADTIRVNLAAKVREPAKAQALRSKLYDTPRDLAVLEQLALAYLADSQPWSAMAIYSRILEISPGRADAMAGIGVARLYVNDLEVAAEWLKKSLKQNTSNAVAVWNLSGLYNEFGFKTLVTTLATKRAKAPKNSVQPLHPMALKL